MDVLEAVKSCSFLVACWRGDHLVSRRRKWCTCGSVQGKGIFCDICHRVFYTGITTVLFKENVIRFRCPHCGKRSVRMEYDAPTVIVSSKWQTQNMMAKCQSCGFQQQTGIQKKSNVFIRYFNVRDKWIIVATAGAAEGGLFYVNQADNDENAW